jgi:hypothetical protein
MPEIEVTVYGWKTNLTGDTRLLKVVFNRG